MNRTDVANEPAAMPGGHRGYPASLSAETRSRRLLRFEHPLRLLACILSGLLLTAAFPPLEWSWLAWTALLPIAALGPVRPFRMRLAGGGLLGLAHCITLFYWLNEIGFFAGFLLGVVVALFPALWYCSMAGISRGAACPGLVGGKKKAVCWGRELGAVFLPAALWVALEWVRSWLFTGLPWGFVGVSQWQSGWLLPLCTVTGVYGLSFLIIAVNIAISRLVLGLARRQRVEFGRRFAIVAGLILLTVGAPWLADRVYPSPPLSLRTVRIGAAQGNIPQARGRADDMLAMALGAYDQLSRSVAKDGQVDLLLWPETAIPAPLRYNEAFANTVQRLCQDTQTPLLTGSIDYRFPSSADAESSASAAQKNGGEPAGESVPLGFNSVFLIDAEGRIREHYDKTHLVPFGEYTPFESLFPFLADWIGMGRSLQNGREFTLFQLPGAIRAGINICYEDCFPQISRAFTQRGAEVLLTLTNDAWYAQSAGSRQHMIHAVFRAVENRRPLMRSGNNSDTCLIQPDGRVDGLLYDGATGNRFIRAARVYSLRAPQALPMTFYTRFGDVFAGLCVFAALVSALPALSGYLRRKTRLFTAVRGMAPR